MCLVPGTGIEPVRPCEHEILSLGCLPVSPSGQRQDSSTTDGNPGHFQDRKAAPCSGPFVRIIGGLLNGHRSAINPLAKSWKRMRDRRWCRPEAPICSALPVPGCPHLA